MSDDKCVRVALRIRPLVSSELENGCVDVLETFRSLKQVRFKNAPSKAFTFNYIFDQNSDQNQLYDECVGELIENLYKGYNVTVLAYGQTGSGKTYTMGTCYNNGDVNVGVIPRTIVDIFNKIETLRCDYDCSVSLAFIELYQECVYDLLSDKSKEQSVLDIREDSNKGIMLPGITEINVSSPADVFNILSRGSSGRATASTNMNATSSRSHAIFTITLNLVNKTDSNDSRTAKLHLVDLAGSERSKKTGAVGITFKEGVNINKGLLVLGNVISALGDSKHHNYIPYRDSNLTRLLKDSLGGNSITLMIACISPADYNYDETLSTLRYADRARKIHNKPIINQDPQSTQIQQLKRTIEELKLQILTQGSSVLCPIEIDNLKKDNLQIRNKYRELTIQLSSTLNDNINLLERIILLQNANDDLFKKIHELRENYCLIFDEFAKHVHDKNVDDNYCNEMLLKFEQIQQQFNVIDKDQKEIELELKDHEERTSSINSSITSSNNDHHHNSLSTSTNEINEQHELHTNNQVELNVRLQELSKQLAIKQRLADQILTNNNNQYNMIDYNGMNENEKKIQQLEKEKDELSQQLLLRQKQQKNPLNDEQRRKRMQELEQQIEELRKKIRQQSQLIKLKDKDDQKIQRLNREILQMKQTKVKLIRSMREENERFKRWKQQRECELLKLKQQDQKKQNEIVKMQVIHKKQQNVLKRKVEEAAAINKRLKEALQLRQHNLQLRNHNNNKTIKIEEKIIEWLNEEIDLYLNIAAAKTTLSGLLDDRATLQKQLNELIIIANNGDDENNGTIKTIQDDIQLRSIQIQDLQQKILDSDEDTRAKTRFDNIQTMSEAKLALKTLFEMIGDLKNNEILKQNKLIESQETQKELIEENAELQKVIKIIDGKHAEDVAKLQRESEEKVAVLLEQLRGNYGQNTDIQMKKRCTILEDNVQQMEIKIQQLMEQVYEYQQENDELQTKINTISVKKLAQGLVVIPQQSSATDAATGDKSEKTDGDFITPVKELRRKRAPKIKVIKHNETFTIDDSRTLDSDIEEEIDNHNNDPDWRNTPIGKFLMAEKKKSIINKNVRKGTKRSSDGGCTCSVSNCTKRCGCKKLNQLCTNLCKCSSASCSNRTNNEKNETVDKLDNTSDQSIKKLRSGNSNNNNNGDGMGQSMVKAERLLF